MEFERKTLGEISINGKGDYGIAAPAIDYDPQKHTYLRITDISDDGTLNLSDRKSVEGENLEKYILKENDIVFARTGASTGRNYFYEKADGELVFAGFLIKFSIDPRKVNPRFIKYYCLSKEYAGWIQSFSTGSTRGNINAQTLANIELRLPPRDYQNRAVEILGSLDKKIAENRAINHNLQQQASALVGHYMQSIDTSVSIANIMSFDSGFPFQSSTYLPSGKYRIITIKNVQDGNIETSNTVFINNLPTRMKNNCILHVGDVLLSLTGNVGRVGIVCEENLLLNQRVAKIVPNDIGLLPLLYFIFRQPDIKLQMELIAKGTAQSNLSPVETLRLTIPFERKTAEALSRTLAPMYQTIISTTQESHSLSSLRDALLPKLMSGEIDVSEVEL